VVGRHCGTAEIQLDSIVARIAPMIGYLPLRGCLTSASGTNINVMPQVGCKQVAQNLDVTTHQTNDELPELTNIRNALTAEDAREKAVAVVPEIHNTRFGVPK